jgi:hypothetical protein
LILIFSFTYISCEKEEKHEKPYLDIEASKLEFCKSYANQNFSNQAVSRDTNESEVCGDTLPKFTFNWDEATQYSPPEYNISIIEVPLSNTNFSVLHSMYGGNSTDSTASNYNLAKSLQQERFLFIFDSAGGLKVSVMKISASALSAQILSTCNYNSISSTFTGIVQFVSPRDSLLEVYQIERGVWMEAKVQNQIQQSGASDRWDCIIIDWIYFKCTGDGHAYGQAGCTCGITSECKPARRVPIMICALTFIERPRPVPPGTNGNGGSGNNNGGGGGNGCACKNYISEKWAGNYQTTFSTYGNYWFNIVQNATYQCGNGNYHGMNSIELVPGQADDGKTIIANSDQIYFHHDIPPRARGNCKWDVNIVAKCHVDFQVTWSITVMGFGSNFEATCSDIITNVAYHVFD